jgi:mxaJ protein
VAALLSGTGAEARELRVCADPNNLPFSNRSEEGFENRIVGIVANELRAEVRYTWWPQRRGFIRSTLAAGLCDLVPGVPFGFELVRTTQPYYRSTYVFLTRPDGPEVTSLDDPVLHEVLVGVQLAGDDGANTPPAHALARRGIVRNIRGYHLYGDYAEPHPPARIVAALARREIDVAVAWGPMAGYFADRDGLRVTPVTPRADGPRLPMVFDIAMGVRREDETLRREVAAALRRRKPEIDAVLAAYHVLRLDGVEERGP